jgi:hypothetical protein
VGLKDRLKRLQRRREKDSLLLMNATRFYYDPIEAAIALFLHTQACLGAHETPEDSPEPPEIIRAMVVVRAQDRVEALGQLFGSEVPAHDTESHEDAA